MLRPLSPCIQKRASVTSPAECRTEARNVTKSKSLLRTPLAARLRLPARRAGQEEVGVQVFAGNAGHGYGTAALVEMLSIAFDDLWLTHVHARAQIGHAGDRVTVKAGFGNPQPVVNENY